MTTPNPADPTAREQLRQQHIAQARQAAEQHARHLYASINCNNNRHAGDPGGCRNDGTTCICECHDLTQREISA